MPIVKVYGAVQCSSFATINVDGQDASPPFLRNKLKETIAGVDALEIKPSEVTVYFLLDSICCDEKESDIIIEITGLFVKVKRTKEIKDSLAKKVVDVMKVYFPDRLVECFVSTFDQTLDGFASSVGT